MAVLTGDGGTGFGTAQAEKLPGNSFFTNKQCKLQPNMFPLPHILFNSKWPEWRPEQLLYPKKDHRFFF